MLECVCNGVHCAVCYRQLRGTVAVPWTLAEVPGFFSCRYCTTETLELRGLPSTRPSRHRLRFTPGHDHEYCQPVMLAAELLILETDILWSPCTFGNSFCHCTTSCDLVKDTTTRYGGSLVTYTDRNQHSEVTK